MRKADVNGTPTVWIAVNNLSKGSDRPAGGLKNIERNEGIFPKKNAFIERI